MAKLTMMCFTARVSNSLGTRQGQNPNRTFLLNAGQPPLPNPPSPGLVGGGVVEASHHPGPVHQQAYSVNEEKHKSLHISHHLAALACSPALVPVLSPSVSDFYLINYLRQKAMSTISLVVYYKPALDAYCL